jgi:hypothetical protein
LKGTPRLPIDDQVEQRVDSPSGTQPSLHVNERFRRHP